MNPSLYHPVLEPLRANALYEFPGATKSDEYRDAQVAILKSIPPEHPVWFHLHVGVRGAWTYPQKFAVDVGLYGRSKTLNEKTDALVCQIIREFTSGVLGFDHLGLALQKLSRISSPAQFEWYRDVLEQRVEPPCSPLLINLHAPSGLGLYMETIPILRGYVKERLDLEIKPVLIEEYLDQRRVFVHPGHRAFDDRHEPMPDYVAFWHGFSPGMDDRPLRVEFYEGTHDITLRDIIPTDGYTPPWQLPTRIDRVLELWDEVESMDVNIVDRRLVEPDQLDREIELIRQRGYPGFSLLRENTDALVFLFERNPRVEMTETQLTLVQDPLNSSESGSIFPVSPTEKESDERHRIQEDQGRPDQR